MLDEVLLFPGQARSATIGTLFMPFGDHLDSIYALMRLIAFNSRNS